MDLLERPTVDAYGWMTIATFGGWNVAVAPMIFNFRLVLIPQYDPLSVDYGWCYPKGPAAFLAARAWDPKTQGEPIGYIKAVHQFPRQIGDTAIRPGDRLIV